MDDEIDRLLRDHAEQWRDAQPAARTSTPADAIGRTPTPIPAWRRRTGLVLVATGCVALIATALALTLRHDDTASPTRVVTSPSTTDAARPVTSVTVPLPDGVHLAAGASAVFDFPRPMRFSVLAVDARRPGLWVWGTTGKPTDAATFGTDSRIWHYEPTSGTLKSWSIGNSGDVLGGVAYPALAACASGVWFGGNDLLLRLDPSTGAQKRYTVPSGAESAATDAHRRDELRGLSGVMALACDEQDGSLLVGLSDSTTAFRFHPSDGTFDPIALPADWAVTMVAASSDGDVAIGLQSYAGGGSNRVMIVPHDGSANRMVTVRDSLVVKADGARFLVGTAAQVIEPGATAASAPLIPDSVVWRFQPGSTVPWPLADGRLVVRGAAPTPAIIEVHPSIDGRPTSTVPVTIGTQRCGPPPVITGPYGPNGPVMSDRNPSVTTTTLDPNRPCPIDVQDGLLPGTFAVDRAGDAYGITNLGTMSDQRQWLVRVHLP